MRTAASLQPGDLIVVRNSKADEPDLVAVLILREQERCRDLFGRDMIRYWARRRDTGKEGYMTYGPDAGVMEQPDFTPEQLEDGGFWKC
jgi:hypothetical protein